MNFPTFSAPCLCRASLFVPGCCLCHYCGKENRFTPPSRQEKRRREIPGLFLETIYILGDPCYILLIESVYIEGRILDFVRCSQRPVLLW